MELSNSEIQHEEDNFKLHEKLPLDVFEKRNIYESKWTEEIILNNTNNSYQCIKNPTLKKETLNKAGQALKEYFEDKSIDLNILEIMCGNCQATNIIYNFLKTERTIINCTDIYDYPNRLRKFNFAKCNGVNAVKNYGNLSNVLLICCPSPQNNYCDLFAIDDYIEQTKENEKKYIIFIGEMGLSDGSDGLYDYMNGNLKLNLMMKKNIYTDYDKFIDSFYEILGLSKQMSTQFATINKDVYIYEIKK
jgi:hypothetical protein